MSNKTNASLMKRREAAVPRGVGQIHPIFAESAKNATVTDVEGREFIDFAGGIAVLNTGHLHPKIIAAVQDQLTKLTHTCFQVLAYEPYVELCEKINAKVPGNFDKKTLLATTGSEAVENAVKIARAATGRAGVIAFTGAYHGRTMMTLGLTGKVVPYSAGMGLMPGGIFRALFPCELHGITVDDSIASIERIFKNDAEPKDIAAIIIEPVQGEGGFYVAPKAFMARLRELCDKHGILLIADEVQTGAGRTGTFFAMEQMGVTADRPPSPNPSLAASRWPVCAARPSTWTLSLQVAWAALTPVARLLAQRRWRYLRCLKKNTCWIAAKKSASVW